MAVNLNSSESEETQPLLHRKIRHLERPTPKVYSSSDEYESKTTSVDTATIVRQSQHQYPTPFSNDSQTPKLAKNTTTFTSQKYVVPIQETHETQGFDINEVLHPHCIPTTKYFIIPFFYMVIGAVIVLYCVWYFKYLTELQSLLIICAGTVVVSWIAAYGVYYYGTIQAVIDYFGQQNDNFERNVDDLHTTKKRLLEETKQMHFQVQKLKQSAASLDEQLEQFDDLTEQLKAIAGSNEEVNDLVDSFVNTIDKMEDFVAKHEAAELWSIYYETVRDCTKSLVERDFNRLLSRMNIRTRQRVIDLGGFGYLDKNGDGCIDVIEFQELIDDLVNLNNEQILEKQQTITLKNIYSKV